MSEVIEKAIARLSEPVVEQCHEGMAARADWLRSLAAGLEAEKGQFAELMAREMGKPLAQGAAEVEKCAWVCRYYADHALEFLTDEVIESGRVDSRVTCSPLGIVLAVMPWNFPFWQVMRFAAPAWMAGNRVLLKHASNVKGCAAALEALVKEVTGSGSWLAWVDVPGSEVEKLIADSRVQAVTFTGSTNAGRAVAEAAGRHLKKCVLELGGSDPYLILADADLAAAAKLCATARMVNNGQSCIAAKRLLVERAVHEEFVACLREQLADYAMGDPLDPETRLGPLARMDLRDELHAQVERSRGAGAEVLLGGKIPEKDGAWYPATLLDQVRPGMPLFDEESFGPVAAVCLVADEEEAVALANRSRFGLGAAVLTGDPDKGRRLAARLKAGTVAINAQVVSDPRLPIGGIKDSGWGRELGREGIREFVNLKTVLEEDLS